MRASLLVFAALMALAHAQNYVISSTYTATDCSGLPIVSSVYSNCSFDGSMWYSYSCATGVPIQTGYSGAGCTGSVILGPTTEPTTCSSGNKYSCGPAPTTYVAMGLVYSAANCSSNSLVFKTFKFPGVSCEPVAPYSIGCGISSGMVTAASYTTSNCAGTSSLSSSAWGSSTCAAMTSQTNLYAVWNCGASSPSGATPLSVLASGVAAALASVAAGLMWM